MEIYLQDMGLVLHRTNNWISEYFGVYGPKRIATLHDERRAKSEGRTSIWYRHWYFSFEHTILLLLVFLLFVWFFF